MTKHMQFHIQFFPPTSLWPNGGWSLYNIDCDQIARRIGFDAQGNVNRRESWPGYIGTFETMAETATAIERAQKESRS